MGRIEALSPELPLYPGDYRHGVCPCRDWLPPGLVRSGNRSSDRWTNHSVEGGWGGAGSGGAVLGRGGGGGVTGDRANRHGHHIPFSNF